MYAHPCMSLLYGPRLEEASLHDGLSKYVNVQEQNIGLQIKGGYDYDYETAERPEMKTWCLGHENSANVALQLKHQWHSLILNAGLQPQRHQHQPRPPTRPLVPRHPRHQVLIIPRYHLWVVRVSSTGKRSIIYDVSGYSFRRGVK